VESSLPSGGFSATIGTCSTRKCSLAESVLKLKRVGKVNVQPAVDVSLLPVLAIRAYRTSSGQRSSISETAAQHAVAPAATFAYAQVTPLNGRTLGAEEHE